MLHLNIKDETSRLRAVVLGTANLSGPVPKVNEAYDPKSLEHILSGTYPEESDLIRQMDGFAAVLQKYGVQVFRPEVIPGCNQIFSRDIAFVIDDKLFKANILPNREREFEAIVHVLDQIGEGQLVVPPSEVHVEGGDVMPWDNFLFVGTYTGNDYPKYITARTNREAIDYLQEQFPNRQVKAFNLRKSNTDPRANALHLDCCFQPVGRNLAILHRESFLDPNDAQWLLDYFGEENVFEIDLEEMYSMCSNIFSIAPDVVVSDKSFKRLNSWLRDRGITVEEIDYQEVGKQGGLLRCSTLPLSRV
jgi:N-dimethylarginine dimethylaminohydrolase